MTKGKRIFNWTSIAVTVTALTFMALKIDISQFQVALLGLNFIWIFTGAAAMVVLWATDAAILRQIIPGITGSKVSFFRCFKYTIVKFYYMALTPYGSAGQPTQILYMINDGIPAGKGTAVAGVDFFVDKVALILVFTTLLILKGRYFHTNHIAIFWISILGYVVNIGLMISIYFLIIRPSFARKLSKAINKLRKNPISQAKTEKTIEEYSEASRFIKTNKRKIVTVVITACLKRSVFIAVPYFIFRAFGFADQSLLSIMALNLFIAIAASFMPTPGASVAAEGSFALVFVNILGAVIVPATVIWRLLTYYMIIIVGSSTLLVSQIIKMGHKRRAISPIQDMSQC